MLSMSKQGSAAQGMRAIWSEEQCGTSCCEANQKTLTFSQQPHLCRSAQSTLPGGAVVLCAELQYHA